MFERYTEKARRTVFFARYEASNFGSPYISPEHLLLGLLREDKRAFGWIPKLETPEAIRQRVEAWIPRKPSTSTSVDLPLDPAAKHILHQAKEEADRLNSKHIGTQHLFIALLQEPECATAKLLVEFGADLEKLRVEFAKQMKEPYSSIEGQVRGHILPAAREAITIHGIGRARSVVLQTIMHYRSQHVLWRKELWRPRDTVVENKSGKLSFDLSLAEDSEHFELIKNGWKKDHCVICRWELFESKEDTNHGTGYTNGRDWICLECYEKFWSRPDFISGSYSEIT